jgi:hypothetical protein
VAPSIIGADGAVVPAVILKKGSTKETLYSPAAVPDTATNVRYVPVVGRPAKATAEEVRYRAEPDETFTVIGKNALPTFVTDVLDLDNTLPHVNASSTLEEGSASKEKIIPEGDATLLLLDVNAILAKIVLQQAVVILIGWETTELLPSSELITQYTKYSVAGTNDWKRSVVVTLDELDEGSRPPVFCLIISTVDSRATFGAAAETAQYPNPLESTTKRTDTDVLLVPRILADKIFGALWAASRLTTMILSSSAGKAAA